MSTKKKISTALVALSMIALVACDTDEMKYPDNYNDKIIENNLHDEAKTAQDTLKQYYQSLTNDDAVYQKTVNKILTILSDNVHGIQKDMTGGSATYSIVNDTIDNVSVADSFDVNKDKYSVKGEDNLLARSKDSMFSTARGGSYKKDNLWDETKYAKYLEQNYYYLTGDYSITTDKTKLLNTIATPDMTYDDVYSSVNSKAYEKYMSEELYDDMKVNYLTSEYIMTKTPASIGNSNARKVQVVSIVDRDDETGDAKKILDKYVDDYILQKNGSTLRDDDFSILSKLWKGITVYTLMNLVNGDESTNNDDVIDSITMTDSGFSFTWSSTASDSDKEDAKTLYARYLVSLNDDGTISVAEKSPVLTAAQTQWLEDATSNNDGSSALVGKILDDKKKINEGLNNWHKIDSSLESTYTGSYTYDLNVGYRNAVDEIATRNLVTDGMYLKSSGISSLPTGLTDRIFSPKVTSSKSTVDEMKEIDPDTGLSKKKEDLTVYARDGYRYMTIADTLSTDSASSILYYDASSKTYYITRILDVVDTNALSTGEGKDTIYDTDAKQEQIKREVAYTMSTTGSYKTDSAVYWLSRLDFTYSDEDFLEYMKSNYKDVFKTENPYSSEFKFDLTKISA